MKNNYIWVNSFHSSLKENNISSEMYAYLLKFVKFLFTIIDYEY